MPAHTRVIAAILARSSSPGYPSGLLTDRALTKVAGKLVLDHIIRRLSTCKNISSTVLAVGDLETDQNIARSGKSLGLAVVAGHPHDPLRRLALAAELHQADHIVRINGNFPLIDPWALDDLIASHLDTKADYSTNDHYQGLVYGLGAEIITSSALKEMTSWGQPGDAYSGTRIFLRRAGDYQVNLQSSKILAPELKASIDFAGDEKIVESILKSHNEPNNLQVIEFLTSHPSSDSQQSSAPTEVGLAKVLLFPRKLEALLARNQNQVDSTYPISVELSLTNACNQNCQWCSDRELRKRAPDHLTIPLLSSLLDDLAHGGVRGVTIEGGGEPTLSPMFSKTVELALDRGLAVGLITNGLEMSALKPHLYSRLEWVRISLDAAHRKQYEEAKGVDGFDRVMGNLANLAHQNSATTLGVGYVLTKFNDDPDRLQHLALTLRSLGVNYLQIRPVVDHPSLVSEQSLDFLKKFDTPDFSVNIGALSENQPIGNLGLPCRAHSLSTVIGADGAVWLCGRLNPDPNIIPMGYLTKNTFQEIWHGANRAQQSAQASNGDFCLSHCPQCRMVKYNQLLHDMEKFKTRNFI